MYSMILALTLAPSGEAVDCRFAGRSVAEYQAGGCTGSRSAPPPATYYAVPAASAGCSGTRSVERFRHREVYRERAVRTPAPRSGCSGTVQVFTVPPCPPGTLVSPPPAAGPDKKETAVAAGRVGWVIQSK
jgi:hypothetical protein